MCELVGIFSNGGHHADGLETVSDRTAATVCHLTTVGAVEPCVAPRSRCEQSGDGSRKRGMISGCVHRWTS